MPFPVRDSGSIDDMMENRRVADEERNANKAVERYVGPAARLLRGKSRATRPPPLTADVGHINDIMRSHWFGLMLVMSLCSIPNTRAETTNAYLNLPIFSQTNLSVCERDILRDFRSATNSFAKEKSAHKVPTIFMLHLGLRPPGIHPDQLKRRMMRADALDLLGRPHRAWSTNDCELLCYDTWDPRKQSPPPLGLDVSEPNHSWLVITIHSGIVVDANTASDPDENGWIRLLSPYLSTQPPTVDSSCEVNDDTLRRWIQEDD
jgi:hypothetical protein